MSLHSSRKIGSSSLEPERIQSQLQLLNQWLDENSHINANKDLDNLHFFLRCCKYDLERTKKKIKAFYLMRAERTEWFANCDPFLPEIQDLLRIGVFLPLDGVDEEQRKMVVIRIGAHNPKVHSQNNVFKVGKMVLDLMLQFDRDSCARGIVAIFDVNGVQLGHALQLNPKLIKHAVDSWHTYPCQPKMLEFVNAPRHINVILKTFKLFMSAKMRSRVFVEKENSRVKCVNLPNNIGGNGLCYEELALKWKQIVEDNADFYKQNEKYKSVLNN